MDEVEIEGVLYDTYQMSWVVDANQEGEHLSKVTNLAISKDFSQIAEYFDGA